MKKQKRHSHDEQCHINARRSWALAEMYLQPLFPPPEVAKAFHEKVEETAQLIENMQAGGVGYDAARRTVIGLPPYPRAT